MRPFVNNFLNNTRIITIIMGMANSNNSIILKTSNRNSGAAAADNIIIVIIPTKENKAIKIRI